MHGCPWRHKSHCTPAHVAWGYSRCWLPQDNTLQGPWALRAKERVICLCEGEFSAVANLFQQPLCNVLL